MPLWRGPCMLPMTSWQVGSGRRSVELRSSTWSLLVWARNLGRVGSRLVSASGRGGVHFAVVGGGTGQ